MIEGIRRIQDMMERQSYITDRAIATTVYLAMELRKPVLIEGQAGVGKTEIAKVLAPRSGYRADSAPVLRGPGRQYRALRVELSQADAPHHDGRGRHKSVQ